MQQNLTTCIIATDVTFIIAIESASCIVPTESATCRIDHWNFYLQKWCQSEIRLVTIKILSEWVSTKCKAKQFKYHLYNLMDKLNSALCQWIVLYTHYFNIQFSYFHNFITQVTLKQSLAQKLNLIFKFSSINRDINIPLWTHMRHKGWKTDGKTFMRCYTIALKFWDEFNANFVLLYFSSYRSIAIWHLYLKNVQKNNKVVHLRLLLTYLDQNLLNIKKRPTLVVKKNCSFSFLCIPD